jgi:glycosyltransferase involved in cell wall biosynthesis
MSDPPLRILTVADVPPDPNSGAAGTVYHTNVALRELGHVVDEIWAEDLGQRRIQHGNLHALLEQPRAYRREVLNAIARQDYDVVMMSQPQAYLAAKAIKQQGFRGIVINRSHGVELRANTVLPTWHRKLGVPESSFPRSMLTPLMRKLLARQWLAVAKWSDGIVVGCELDRQFLIGQLKLPKYRVTTIAHGVAHCFHSTPLATRTPLAVRRLLHVGQFAFFKGSYLLIEIVNRVLSACDHSTFTWVCSRMQHSAIRDALAPPIKARVTLLDTMALEKLVEVYDGHGVFVFPSLFEGFGKAPFEAMARGLCVVASDEGGMHDIIQDKVNGLLCPCGNPNMFVELIKSLLDSPEQTMKVACRGWQSARALTWQRCASACFNFFQAIESERTAALIQTKRAVSRVSNF